jgi:hypothetical protein
VQLDPVTDSAYGTYDVWEHVYLSALLGADVMTLVNEVGHDTQRDFSRQELLELRDHARAAGFTGPIALGAPVDLDELPEPGVDFPLAGGDYIPVHLARGKTPWYREGCRVKEQWEISRHHGVPTLNEEENRVEDTGYPVGFAYLTAILPRGFGGGTLFHSAQAREATAALSGVQLDALRAFVRGQNVLRDSRGPLTFYNARAAGSPVGTAAFVEPIPGDPEGETVWRCYSFVAGNEGMVVICGPNPDDPRIVWANGWEQRGVLDRVPVGGSTPAEGGGVTVLYIGR